MKKMKKENDLNLPKNQKQISHCSAKGRYIKKKWTNCLMTAQPQSQQFVCEIQLSERHNLFKRVSKHLNSPPLD